MFMNAGIGEIAGNRVAVQLISGCRNRSFTAYCSDMINFMVRFTHSSWLIGRPATSL